MIIPLEHFLIFSTLMFGIGAYGAMTRRSILGILISLELIFNAANINLAAFSKTTSLAPEAGQVFAAFVIALAAASSVTGIAIVLVLFRIKKSVLTDEIQMLKW